MVRKWSGTCGRAAAICLGQPAAALPRLPMNVRCATLQRSRPQLPARPSFASAVNSRSGLGSSMALAVRTECTEGFALRCTVSRGLSVARQSTSFESAGSCAPAERPQDRLISWPGLFPSPWRAQRFRVGTAAASIPRPQCSMRKCSRPDAMTSPSAGAKAAPKWIDTSGRWRARRVCPVHLIRPGSRCPPRASRSAAARAECRPGRGDNRAPGSLRRSARLCR